MVGHEQLADPAYFPTFQAVKQRIFAFARLDSNSASLCSGTFCKMAAFAGYTEAAHWHKTLLNDLLTDGAYSEEQHIQLAALALQVNLTIQYSTSETEPRRFGNCPPAKKRLES